MYLLKRPTAAPSKVFHRCGWGFGVVAGARNVHDRDVQLEVLYCNVHRGSLFIEKLPSFMFRHTLTQLSSYQVLAQCYAVPRLVGSDEDVVP